MSEILASDKGRSHPPVLNALLRRAAGLCVVSGIGWRRRHIETGRNPTDAGSRLADSGLLRPGAIVERSRAQKSADAAGAWRGAARACGMTAAAFRTAASSSVPQSTPRATIASAARSTSLTCPSAAKEKIDLDRLSEPVLLPEPGPVRFRRCTACLAAVSGLLAIAAALVASFKFLAGVAASRALCAKPAWRGCSLSRS